MDGPPENDICSICHAHFHIPCQANCSHWFCGSCICRLWEHAAALQPCKCPLCRRVITMLVPGEGSSTQNAEVAEILQRLERYNRLYGEHSNGLLQRMQDLPFLLKRLLRDIMDPQRSLPLVIRARVYLAGCMCRHVLCGLLKITCTSCTCPSGYLFEMIVSAIYVLSPVDIIPEGLLGIFGLIDDLIIVFICFLHIGALYRAVLLTRHGGPRS